MKWMALTLMAVFLTAGPVDAYTWAEDTGQPKAEAGSPQTPGKADPKPATPQGETQNTVAPGNLSLPDFVEKVEPSVVKITTNRSLGSGFVVDDSGLVITNYHVIRGSREAKVTFQNELSAEVSGYVAVDKGKDLIVLRTKAKAKLTPLPLRPTPPRKGENVVAFGAPEGFSGSVSQGIVSAVRKGAEISDVIRGIIGIDEYRWMGYDAEATWIQTTAPISDGNSGGPLVDMNGNVVGVNTWTTKDAQNLNFAISSMDIKAVLANLTDDCRDLTTLPSLRGGRPIVATGPLPPGVIASSIGFSAMELPSGSVFAETIVKIPVNWQTKMFPDDAPVYVGKYPNGEVRGVYTFHEGKLHGPAAGLYESGQLHILANYHMSYRDGPLRLWEQDRQRLLYAEYTRGNKNGFVCLFRDGMPWLVQQWDRKHLLSECLVKWAGDIPTVVPKEKAAEGEDAQELGDAQEELAKLEAEMEEGETQLKRGLRDWYREEAMRIKRERAAKLSVARSRAASGRRQAREAANAAAYRGMWRGALSRSGF